MNNTQAHAIASLMQQCLEHAQRFNMPLPPLVQIAYCLCEDGRTVAIDWYLEDGFNAMAYYTPDKPGTPLPDSWHR